MRSRPGPLAIAATTVAALVAACTGGGEVGPEPAATPVTTASLPTPTVDGRLTLGLLLPVTDALLGEPLVAAATDAVDEINRAGGVLGGRVSLVVGDEGTTPATALTSIEQLINAEVDAIVGPASSTVALATLDEIVSAGLLACSPTASALALDGFPDENLFFRTIPSDSLQALAIAGGAEATGAGEVALAYVDDAYGRPFAAAVEQALAGSSATLVASVPFAATDDDLTDNAAELVDSGATTAIVLAAGIDSARFIDALGRVDYEVLRSIVVNDAARVPATQAPFEALAPELRRLINGVAPQAFVDETMNGPFASNVVDCINLIALGAMQANSDSPRAIAGQMASVSTGGSACRRFEQCADQIDGGLQIDYTGANGVVELGGDGDPDRAVFERFVIDDTGRGVISSTTTVNAA